MSDATARRGFTLYLRVWAVLLGLTIAMVAIDRSDLRLLVLAAILVAAMLLKAGRSRATSSTCASRAGSWCGASCSVCSCSA